MTESRPRTQTTTYLQLPSGPTAPQLIRQRSQPIPGPSGTIALPATVNASSTPTSPPQSINIPTLAVTPVSSAPNIVIEQYPTILRLVSIEEMNAGTEPITSSLPALTRASSYLGKINKNCSIIFSDMLYSLFSLNIFNNNPPKLKSFRLKISYLFILYRKYWH